MIDPKKNSILLAGPKRVMRWGGLVIMTLIITSVALSFFIKYPDILLVKLLTISSEQSLNINPGELSAFIIKDKQIKYESDTVNVNISKISGGQDIYIKVGNFEKDGLLKGKIKSVENIENDTLAIVIKLDDDLITTYHKKIRYTVNMSGSAEIIFKNQSLINKWLSSFK